MNIVAIDHTAVNVSDLAASRKFYTEGLGLKEIARPDFDFDGVWYKVGKDQQFHLIVMGEVKPQPDPRLNHHFAFRVADVDATEKELTSRGVNILGRNKRPDGVTQIFVKDPDGYVTEFSNNLV